MTLIEKVLDIERKELGYTEQTSGWTKYGDWYEKNIAHVPGFSCSAWCAMFQTWSMAQAGVPEDQWPYVSPYGSEVNYLAAWLTERGFRTGADDMPRPGDLVFYSWSGSDDDLDHVGMVSSVTGRTPDNALLYVIEGNKSDKVDMRTIRYRDNTVRMTFRLPAAEETVFPALSFMLRKGDSGYSVEILQAGLISRGYDIYGGVDGYFGAKTEEALKKYQSDIDIEVDGKAGTVTFSHLLSGG